LISFYDLRFFPNVKEMVWDRLFRFCPRHEQYRRRQATAGPPRARPLPQTTPTSHLQALQNTDIPANLPFVRSIVEKIPATPVGNPSLLRCLIRHAAPCCRSFLRATDDQKNVCANVSTTLASDIRAISQLPEVGDWLGWEENLVARRVASPPSGWLRR
jgi:hypothetical protein